MSGMIITIIITVVVVVVVVVIIIIIIIIIIIVHFVIDSVRNFWIHPRINCNKYNIALNYIITASFPIPLNRSAKI